MFESIQPINVDDILQRSIPDTEYFKEEYVKSQIVLHHTVSGPSADGDISSWLNDGQRVSTFALIDREGMCHQMFPSRYWSHHIGLKSEKLRSMGLMDFSTRNLDLNRKSIGIELDNWGPLIKSDDGYHTAAYGNKVDVPVVEYENPYRGYTTYESYTVPQLITLGSLLLYLCDKYNIPIGMKRDLFKVNLNAIRGEPGIWTHSSFREDKSDCHPDPMIIEMLSRLTQSF